MKVDRRAKRIDSNKGTEEEKRERGRMDRKGENGINRHTGIVEAAFCTFISGPNEYLMLIAWTHSKVRQHH